MARADMGRNVVSWSLGLGVLAVLGCQSAPEYSTTVPYVEEFRVPPNEERFDNPPEQGYRKPPEKKEFKPGFGAGGPGMGGGNMMGPGM